MSVRKYPVRGLLYDAPTPPLLTRDASRDGLVGGGKKPWTNIGA
ncbi:hypothetical protein HMPREF0290_2605 [Corynebacterium efficiens YS-314]|nr:hypothetical protein HMPREF0290_2605 [Corynebacterium efficiens YS-314]